MTATAATANPQSNGAQKHHVDDNDHARPSKRVKADADGANGGDVDGDDDDEDLIATARLLDGNQDENEQTVSAKATKQQDQDKDDARRRKKQQEEEEEDDQVHKQRAAKLKFLLQRSGVYSQIMADKMEKERKARIEASEATAAAAVNGSSSGSRKQNGSAPSGTGRTTRAGDAADKPQIHEARPKRANAGKRKKDDDEWEVSNYISKDDLKGKDSSATASPAPSASSSSSRPAHSRQPALVTGAELRPYQLDGFEWLVSLYENGLNGILADEMGLGKTLQTISFLAHLRGKGVWGPFLIVAPLSTIANWVTEFERFTPGIPAMMYHAQGKPERAQLRKQLRYPASAEEKRAFPVVITSFEIAMMDRQHLSHLKWKYIVVDEGHRLKNMNCRLIQELKRFNSAQRLILTGTPLHNNLKELWSLLNFILPDIFDDLETFEKWFDFSDISQEGGSNRLLTQADSKAVITQLHAILKPFLLRRMKTDVESSLPPKKEYLLYAPLTSYQKELYESCVHGTIRKWLLERKTGMTIAQIQRVLDEEGGSKGANLREWMSADLDLTKSAKSSRAGSVDSSSSSSSGGPSSRRHSRKAARKVNYQEGEGDEQFIDLVEGSGDENEDGRDDDSQQQRQQQSTNSSAQLERQGQLYAIRQAQREINNMKLQNLFMQLRKICCHPYLFDWPREPDGTQVVDKGVVTASGKMLLLNRLLDALFAKKHKVLIFSQFTTILDVIESWAQEYKHIETCRIDGVTSQEERRRQMKLFNESEGPNAVKLFLLSTRAGGLGINLVAADTVIFYDSDWNPQMDLQAQDRVHRIGQTKPVLIFRLVSANTVESRLLKRAGDKRKLEAIVIKDGAFRLPAGAVQGIMGKGGNSTSNKGETMSEVAKSILALEGEKVQLAEENDEIISDAQLETLLDRSPAIYASRGMGWVSAGKDGMDAFEVTETNADGANENLAKLMAEG